MRHRNPTIKEACSNGPPEAPPMIFMPGGKSLAIRLKVSKSLLTISNPRSLSVISITRCSEDSDDSEDDSDCAADDQADTPNPPQIKLVDEFDKELEEMLKEEEGEQEGEQKVLARRRRRR